MKYRIPERVQVQIYFTRAITEADRAALRRVGVSDIGQFLTRLILGTTAADGALPEIQRIPGVEFARAQAFIVSLTSKCSARAGTRATSRTLKLTSTFRRRFAAKVVAVLAAELNALDGAGLECYRYAQHSGWPLLPG